MKTVYIKKELLKKHPDLADFAASIGRCAMRDDNAALTISSASEIDFKSKRLVENFVRKHFELPLLVVDFKLSRLAVKRDGWSPKLSSDNNELIQERDSNINKLVTLSNKHTAIRPSSQDERGAEKRVSARWCLSKFVLTGIGWGLFWLVLASLFVLNKNNEHYLEKNNAQVNDSSQKLNSDFPLQSVEPIKSANLSPDVSLNNVEPTSSAPSGGLPYIRFGKDSLEGKKTIILFADPACPHCKKMDAQIPKLVARGYEVDLYPIDALGTSSGNIESLLCNSKVDKQKLWSSLTNNSAIEQLHCLDGANSLATNAALHQRLGFTGVPVVIAKSNGNFHSGDMTADEAEQLFLSSPPKQ